MKEHEPLQKSCETSNAKKKKESPSISRRRLVIKLHDSTLLGEVSSEIYNKETNETKVYLSPGQKKKKLLQSQNKMNTSLNKELSNLSPCRSFPCRRGIKQVIRCLLDSCSGVIPILTLCCQRQRVRVGVVIWIRIRVRARVRVKVSVTVNISVGPWQDSGYCNLQHTLTETISRHDILMNT